MFFNGNTPSQDKCCGCGACLQICGHNAIQLGNDSNGFIMPVVDLDKCVECGLCEKVCPIVNKEDFSLLRKRECYAAINKDHDELFKSSSGGIFSAIADYVLSKGGIVYGASFDENLQLRHCAVETISDLNKLRGSKYLQSSTDVVYKDIRKNLAKGRLVYFTGTGCQVWGLRRFLMREYDNLICSDILCHGTPNKKVFDYVIRELEKKYSGKVVEYKFRDKSVNGWSCSSSSSSIKVGNKIKYVGFDPLMIAYFNAFLSGCMYREVCYVCPFANDRRTGDITLGDFWGVENYIKIKNRKDGVSAIIVNTTKGERILGEISPKLTLIRANIEDIAVVNETLRHPTPRPDSRDTFFEDFKNNPERALMNYLGNINRASKIYKIKKFAQSNIIFKSLYKCILNFKK